MMRTLGTTLWLRISKPQWPRGVYVTHVTHFRTTHTSVTKHAPCVRRHQPLWKISATCNRWFLSEKCFQNHLTLKVKGKLVCQWRQVCRNCSYTVNTDSKHECFKRFCNYCNKKQPSGHFCYMVPLKPSKLTSVFVCFFFDTVCTQDLE